MANLLILMELIKKNRHSRIKKISWDPIKVKNKIRSIYDSGIFFIKSRQIFLPKNKTEKNFFEGMAGILWALLHLAKTNRWKIPFNPEEIIHKIDKLYLSSLSNDSLPASLFIGRTGILLTQVKIKTDLRNKKKLYQWVKQISKDEFGDLLFGMPGIMLAILFLYRWTNDENWKKLYLNKVDLLLKTWTYDKKYKIWYWPKKRLLPFTGLAHGFLGDIFPILSGLELISLTQKQILLERIYLTLKKIIRIDGNRANFRVSFYGNRSRSYLIQWCHSAAGMLLALENYPKKNKEIEYWVSNVAKTIWQAGPMAPKYNTSMCHGTAGNGMLLLKYYQKTQDKKWLSRARAFAMHDLEQKSDSYGLYNGEMGKACFLQACLDKRPFFPGLDVF